MTGVPMRRVCALFPEKKARLLHNTSEPENLARGYDLEIRTHSVVCNMLIYQGFLKSYNSTRTNVERSRLL